MELCSQTIMFVINHLRCHFLGLILGFEDELNQRAMKNVPVDK